MTKSASDDQPYRAVVVKLIEAWEATKPGDTSVREIQRWLIEDMAPAVDAARALLAASPPASAQVTGDMVLVPREPLEDLADVERRIMESARAGQDVSHLEDELGEAVAIFLKATRAALHAGREGRE